MFVSQKDALRFYFLSQYPVTSAFLRCDRTALEEAFQKAFDTHCAVIRRALDETPAVCFGVSEEEGRILLATFRRRTPETLTEQAKKEMLFQDIEDLHLLIEMMEPAGEELCILSQKPEKESSDSEIWPDVRYGEEAQGKEIPEGFCRIRVPAGFPCLKYEGKVILPPMKIKNENGEICAQQDLPLDPQVVQGLMSYGL